MFNDVITFWFEDIDPVKWWVKDEAFDSLILSMFGSVHQQAVLGELSSWRKTAEGRLAEVIVIDQFSRNIYRDRPQSFAFDSIALSLAKEAVAGGFDVQLDAKKRGFLYLPYMHSESLIVHKEAELLFASLGIETMLEAEHKHSVIIERFGRYPHRNKILGRESTEEEMDFLQSPNSGF